MKRRECEEFQKPLHQTLESAAIKELQEATEALAQTKLATEKAANELREAEVAMEGTRFRFAEYFKSEKGQVESTV